jgi:hypothetical protein
MKFINFRSKSVSPLIASILLIVVSVIFVVIFLTWSQSFTNEELNKQSNLNDLELSDAEHYIYPKTFSNGLMQFNYSPPANLGTKDIVIAKYKILYDNTETDIITLNSSYTLKQGLNVLNLSLFTDQNIPSRKFTIILETEDSKYITLRNISNPYPYVEPVLSSDKFITQFTILSIGIDGTIDNDLNTIILEVPYGTNVTNLTPTILISEYATVNPQSGSAQNFTNPVEYTVTAEDDSTKIYTVTINVLESEEDWILNFEDIIRYPGPGGEYYSNIQIANTSGTIWIGIDDEDCFPFGPCSGPNLAKFIVLNDVFWGDLSEEDTFEINKDDVIFFYFYKELEQANQITFTIRDTNSNGNIIDVFTITIEETAPPGGV